MTEIRKKTVQGLKIGDIFSISRTFTKEDVLAFARISRDENPVHSNAEFIKLKGFNGPICHGLLVASMLTEIGGQIGWLASKMDLKFIRPVYVNETIECSMEIVSIDAENRAKADVRFKNSRSDIVLVAELHGILPNNREQQVLGKLI